MTQTGRCSSKLPALCLGLFWCFLLIGIIMKDIYHISSKAEIESLKSHLRNMSKERDQLSSLVHNLTGALVEKELEAWKTFGSSYYYISNVRKTWEESRRLCLERGADLVIINDKAEQEFIYYQSIYTWIGLSDVQSEGVWRWVDGSPLTNGFWKKGEPNNADENEDCVSFQLTNPGMNTWNDIPCIFEAWFICESAKPPLKRVKPF